MPVRSALTLLAASFLITNAMVATAAEPTPSKETTTLGDVLLADPLATPPAAPWRAAKGRWQVVDGALQGAELKADNHGAVVRRELKFADAVIEFDFRLDGAKGISFSINDPKGHNSRLAIRPAGYVLTKDDHDHEGPDKRVVLAEGTAKFEPGRWYPVRLVVAGEELSATIGDHKAGGKHPAIAVAKSNIGLTVAGESASFRNLKISAPIAP